MIPLAEFINKYQGRGVDVDGFPDGNKYQCTDLWRAYVKEVLSFPQSRAIKGAKDIWTTFLPGFYEQIENTPDGVPQAGDVIVWGASYNSYGHVAVFTDGTAATFTCFSQNDPPGALCGLRKYKSYKGVLGWLRPKSIMKKDEMTDQTKIPIGGEWGDMELQALRSKLNDLSSQNASMGLALKQAKDDLQTESEANRAQVEALNTKIKSLGEAHLGDLAAIAKVLGSDVAPEVASINRAVITLIEHEKQLDDSQRLNKKLIQKPLFAVMEEFISNLLKKWSKK